MMTRQQYLDQNLKGFEGDAIARDTIERILGERCIDIVIETGTYLGSSTRRFAEMPGVNHVFSIEVNPEHWAKANENLKDLKPKVNLLKGNSPEALDILLQMIPNHGPRLFFFLDAHWEEYNPLLDELRVIAEFNRIPKPVIAIHDFKVPGRPDLGFDSYKGQDYDFEWIQSAVERIYGQTGYQIKYNDQAEGAKRGIIYIFPL